VRLRRVLAFLAIAVVAMLAVSWWFQTGEPRVQPGSALVLDLAGRYLEAPEPSWMARLLGGDARSFAALHSSLALAARDARLDTVVLRIGELELGWGKAQELRGAIRRLREAGRGTIAYLEIGSYDANLEYYVASAAERVVLPPGGAAPVVGLAAEYLYLGGLWEKLGVAIDVERAGRYKSAAESLTEERMSEDARRMAEALLDSLDAQFIAGVAESRGLEPAQARAAIDAGPVVASELEGLRLVDGTAHLSELLEPFGERVIEAAAYSRVSPHSVGFEADAQFALVYASGTVVVGEGRSGRSGQPIAASRTLAEPPRTRRSPRSCCASTARAARRWPRSWCGTRCAASARSTSR
jgi:protease-4